MSPLSRLRFNFSSRTLLVAVAVLAVLFATVGRWVVHEVRERRATSVIQQLGGRFDSQQAASLEGDGWPARLMSLVLYEDFAHVTHVSVNGTGIQDADLAVFQSLPRLEGLDISNTDITDASVAHLAVIPNLKYVNAHQTRLTEAGVAELKSRRPGLVVDWQTGADARARAGILPSSEQEK